MSSRWGSQNRLRWWGFFVLKNGLLVGVVCLFSIDLVEGALLRLGLVPLLFRNVVAMWAFLVGINVALGWSIRDEYSLSSVPKPASHADNAERIHSSALGP